MVQIASVIMLPLFDLWACESEILSFMLLDLTLDKYNNKGLRGSHLGDYHRPG